MVTAFIQLLADHERPCFLKPVIFFSFHGLFDRFINYHKNPCMVFSKCKNITKMFDILAKNCEYFSLILAKFESKKHVIFAIF